MCWLLHWHFASLAGHCSFGCRAGPSDGLDLLAFGLFDFFLSVYLDLFLLLFFFSAGRLPYLSKSPKHLPATTFVFFATAYPFSVCFGLCSASDRWIFFLVYLHSISLSLDRCFLLLVVLLFHTSYVVVLLFSRNRGSSLVRSIRKTKQKISHAGRLQSSAVFLPRAHLDVASSLMPHKAHSGLGSFTNLCGPACCFSLLFSSSLVWAVGLAVRCQDISSRRLGKKPHSCIYSWSKARAHGRARPFT